MRDLSIIRAFTPSVDPTNAPVSLGVNPWSRNMRVYAEYLGTILDSNTSVWVGKVHLCTY